MDRCIQLKKAADGDIETIRVLAERIWFATYSEMVPQGQIEYMLLQRYAPEILRQQLGRGDEIQLAFRGDVMVGFIHARLGDSGECLLDKLYVAPEYQHQGVGEALFLSVRDWAQRRCLTSITLRVNRNNERAIRAYQKYGFRIVGEDRKPIGEGYVMDDFIMKTSI